MMKKNNTHSMQRHSPLLRGEIANKRCFLSTFKPWWMRLYMQAVQQLNAR